MLRALNRKTGTFRKYNHMLDTMFENVSLFESVSLFLQNIGSWFCCGDIPPPEDYVVRNTPIKPSLYDDRLQLKELKVETPEIVAVAAGPVVNEDDAKPVVFKTSPQGVATALQTRFVIPQNFANLECNQPSEERQALARDCAEELWGQPSRRGQRVKVNVERWLAGCAPRKRDKLTKARQELLTEPLNLNDATINTFVKTECGMKKVVDGVTQPNNMAKPRAISDRSPRYTVAQTPAFQQVGKILNMRAPCFVQDSDIPSNYVYASGKPMAMINDWLNAAIIKLQQDAPGQEIVFLTRDASSWDGHNSTWLTEFSAGDGKGKPGYWHRVEKYLIWQNPKDRANFLAALDFMPNNKIRACMGKLKAKLPRGGRKSGDGCTSCGNSADNIIMDMVGAIENGCDRSLLYTVVLGDDAETVTTRTNAEKLAAYYCTDPFGMQYNKGKGVNITSLTGDVSQVSFCSMPIWRVGDRFCFGLDPDRILRKTFWSKSLAKMSKVTKDDRTYYAIGVSKGLLGGASPVDGLYDLLLAISQLRVPALSKRRRAQIDEEVTKDREHKIVTNHVKGYERTPSGNLQDVIQRSRIIAKLDIDTTVKQIKEQGLCGLRW
jgi:hypothetical protein